MFRRFSLDTQQFFIRLQCLNPEEDYGFAGFPELNGIRRRLGKAERRVAKHDASTR